MFNDLLDKIVKCAFGVQEDRKEELVQYKEYEIYLTPRQEDAYEVGVYRYGRSVNQVTEVNLSRDEIVRLACEWIDENEQWSN